MSKEETPKKSVGRPRKIESPEKLWDLFCEYKEQNGMTEVRTVDKKGNEHFIEYPKILTMQGFTRFLRQELNDFKINKGYLYELNELQNDGETYSVIIRAIREEMHASCQDYGQHPECNPNYAMFREKTIYKLNEKTEKDEKEQNERIKRQELENEKLQQDVDRGKVVSNKLEQMSEEELEAFLNGNNNG